MQTPISLAPPLEYKSIQALRAIAALLVALMHLQFFYVDSMVYIGGPTPHMVQFYNFKGFGGCGVQLFFVISGFIMAYLQAKGETDNIWDFAGRRLTRVVPLYWIATFFWTFVLAGAANIPTDKLLHSLFFIPQPDNQTVVGPGWTLNFEMLFYVLFGICTLVLRRSVVWIGVAFLVLNLIFAMTGNYLARLYSDPVVWNFVAGIVIFHIHRMPQIQRDAKAIFLAGVVLLLSTILWHIPNDSKGVREFLPWGVPSMLIVLGATSMESVGAGARAFGNGLLQVLGEASYSLYLVHTLCFFGVSNVLLYQLKVQQYVGPDLAILVYLAVCCVLAVAVNKFVERPSIKGTRLFFRGISAMLRATARPPRAG